MIALCAQMLAQNHFIVSNWHEFFLFFFIQNLLCNAWVGDTQNTFQVFFIVFESILPYGRFFNQTKDLCCFTLWKASSHKPPLMLGLTPLGYGPQGYNLQIMGGPWDQAFPYLSIIPYYQHQIRFTQSCIGPFAIILHLFF